MIIEALLVLNVVVSALALGTYWLAARAARRTSERLDAIERCIWPSRFQ